MSASAQQQAVFDMFAAWQRGEMQLAPVTELLGIAPVSIGAGRAELAWPATSAHHNVMGTVHGGLLCAFADVATGVALATLMDGEGFTTLHQAMEHLRPTAGSDLVARAEIVRRGRQAAHATCAIEDADGRLLARASSVWSVFPLSGGA